LREILRHRNEIEPACHEIDLKKSAGALAPALCPALWHHRRLLYQLPAKQSGKPRDAAA
jgi:hypothetical protein